MNGFTEHKLPGVRLFGGDSELVLPFLLKEEVDAIVTDPPAGISFMGKSWDADKGGRDEWVKWLTRISREMLRTLKPGGHALVWALPRTSHWTATALEDAGFEIRDVITHIFGSGFPKSTDVSKAIDKAAGVERPVIGKISAPASTKRVQTMGRPEHSGSGWNEAPDLTAPATDGAKRFDGFGTALKPAAENWILCRKPLVFAHTTVRGKRKREKQTVAEAALKHGTGALNIKDSRIGAEKRTYKGAGGTKTTMVQGSPWADGRGKDMQFEATGRWPANLVISEEIEAKLGESGKFFYCAKSSKKERGEDNNHPTVKPIALMSYLIKLVTPPGGAVLDPFMGSGTTGVAARQEGFKFIGIERDPNYMRIAERRIANAKENVNDQARSASAAHHQ